MKILRSTEALQAYLSEGDRPVGLVPTMGYLHAGHDALMQAAKRENKRILLSVFVNPTQFNEDHDFQTYPRDESRDLARAQAQGVDAVWFPQVADIYPEGDTFLVHEQQHNSRMEGVYRPGHFHGVATVILKLCQLVKPEHIYMGEKDYQQLELVRDLIRCFFLPIKVVAVPTQREDSGLAMSSRNARLSEQERKQAANIYRALVDQPSPEAAKQALEDQGFKVDYVEDFSGRRFVAAWLRTVRLIDNVELSKTREGGTVCYSV